MKILNKKARFEYKFEDDKYEAGISLLGAEARALRDNRADLSHSVARILNGELWLINASIAVPQPPAGYNPTRMRKLLLHKDEVVSISTKTKARGLTLVPIMLYTKGRLVKVKLAVGKPKRMFEKKEVLKKKDIEREIAKEFKNSV